MQINYRLFYLLFIVSIMASCDPEEMPTQEQAAENQTEKIIFGDDGGEEDDSIDDEKN